MEDIKLYDNFISLHKSQLELAGVKKHLWFALYRKLIGEIFDAGEIFQLNYEDNETNGKIINTVNQEFDVNCSYKLSVVCKSGVRLSDPTTIYLVDHAWTFRKDTASCQLEQHTQLTDRLCKITGVNVNDGNRVEKLLKKMWRFCHNYTINNEELTTEEQLPIWYIMDEVGSAVAHSDDPNFRLVPFLYINKQITYSLLFPLRDCLYNEIITHDFVGHPIQGLQREALRIPWQYKDMRNEKFIQTEPDIEYFTSGRIEEILPSDNMIHDKPKVSSIKPLKVYAEYEIIKQNLTDPNFHIVEEESDADVLWLMYHYKNFAELFNNTPNKFVNQFPFEYLITVKDLLSVIARRGTVEHHNPKTLETYPNWLPTTYNLRTELVQFVSYYQHRATKGLNNYWIIKPWNLARGLDIHITDDLVKILRISTSGPKIAQKYIEQPVLFNRFELKIKVKFDIRYVILLKTVEPLEAYVYRNFFLRFANHEFSLDHFDDYEKHFTVMNYNDADLHNVKCEDFLKEWDQQYPNHKWSNIEDDICEMLAELLICATKYKKPCGIAPCSLSRALYAADIILEFCENGFVQPKLLEINWSPDCKRACDYYPGFFNNIFKLLFQDKVNNNAFRLLQTNVGKV